MQRIARNVVATRVKPDIKEALPKVAEAAGYKNVSRYVEYLIETALRSAQTKPEKATGAGR